MNGFSLTPAQANTLIDKLYEIWGRKFGIEITLIRKDEKNESENKKMCLGKEKDTSKK